MLENLFQLLTLASFPSPSRDSLSYRCQAAPSSPFSPRVSAHTASNTQHPMAALAWQLAKGWNKGRSLGNEKLSPGMGKRGQESQQGSCSGVKMGAAERGNEQMWSQVEINSLEQLWQEVPGGHRNPPIFLHYENSKHQTASQTNRFQN